MLKNNLGIWSHCLWVSRTCFFFKMVLPGLFFIYVCLFKHTLQFLLQIIVKKCPSSIQCRDSNSRPLEQESPPITTRPGLPPASRTCWCSLRRRRRVQPRSCPLIECNIGPLSAAISFPFDFSLEKNRCRQCDQMMGKRCLISPKNCPKSSHIPFT